MRTDDTPPQIVAANAARTRMFADAAARDPAKLAKAVRVVVAALALEQLTFGDLRRELEQRAEKTSA